MIFDVPAIIGYLSSSLPERPMAQARPHRRP